MDFTFAANKMEILLQSINLQWVVFSGIKACNYFDSRSQMYMFNKPAFSILISPNSASKSFFLTPPSLLSFFLSFCVYDLCMSPRSEGKGRYSIMPLQCLITTLIWFPSWLVVAHIELGSNPVPDPQTYCQPYFLHLM